MPCVTRLVSFLTSYQQQNIRQNSQLKLQVSDQNIFSLANDLFSIVSILPEVLEEVP